MTLQTLHFETPRAARCCSAVVALALALAPAAIQASSGPDPRSIDAALDGWRPEEAEEMLAELQAASPDEPTTLLAAAKVHFQRGRYAQAVAALDALRRVAGRIRAYDDFDALVRTTAAKTSRMQSMRSDNFEVWTEPGPDTMLAPFVLETLEAALTAYRKDLGIAIPAQARPLRVEVYARTSDFVAVSTLTAKEVSTSGTVALCKFNRMMIVSPRRLARGYRWRDTLAHELVHFLLSRHTRNQLPLWLHEGIAKYEERRWSGPNDGRLHPIQQSILAEGRARNVYVPFREMMPSLAKLDSGWKTSLAFAEVTLLVKQILDDGGPERLRAVIDAFARGEAEGFRALGVVDEEELWNNFVARLRSTELTAVPGYKFIPLSVSEDEVDAEPEPIDDGAARKFTRLGDLLREQGYWQSAISEYTKARSKLGYSPAPLSLRFAEALMVGGLYHEAEMELRNLIVRDPDRATAHALLGKIALFRGDAAEALRRYETAFAIAPFVEAVVTGLAEAADRANDSNKRRMYRDALEAWHELKRGT